MSAEQLKLAGLENRKPDGILDSEEKVRQFAEEMTKRIEDGQKVWENVKRDTQEKANRCVLS